MNFSEKTEHFFKWETFHEIWNTIELYTDQIIYYLKRIWSILSIHYLNIEIWSWKIPLIDIGSRRTDFSQLNNFIRIDVSPQLHHWHKILYIDLTFRLKIYWKKKLIFENDQSIFSYRKMKALECRLCWVSRLIIPCFLTETGIL